jgi:hypothetical protein
MKTSSSELWSTRFVLCEAADVELLLRFAAIHPLI